MSDLINIQDLNCLSNKKLRKLVADVETTLIELKQELERREELKQAQAIEHLDEYIDSAESSLQSIKQFMAYITQNLKNHK